MGGRRYDEARRRNRRVFARANPDNTRHLPALRSAATLNILGVLHRDQNRRNGAGTERRLIALEYVPSRLARANPDTYLPEGSP
jgi:hypothetical protein